jgi:hypothetical protein
MTYGDFAWNDLLRKQTPQRRRRERPRGLFVEGDPVPWMDFGEDDWVWRVSRVVRRPVLDVVAEHPRSVWVQLTHGDRPGVKVGDVAPPFPPKIERVVEVPFTSGRDDLVEIRQALAKTPPLRGSGDVGLQLGFGRVPLGNFDYGGPVRVMFDALSKTLGGTEGRPGDLRITDLRVTREPGRIDGCEIRLWSIDR